MKKKAQIMEILLRVKPLFKGNFEQDNLDIYTEMLIEFESSQVFEAIKRLSRKNTFFPAYAEIVKEIEQPVDIDALARVEIPKVWQAVRKYGRSRYKEAQEFMGEMLWQAVGHREGFVSLCDSETAHQSIYNAQIREALKSIHMIEQSRQIKEHDKKMLDANNVTDLLPE